MINEKKFTIDIILTKVVMIRYALITYSKKQSTLNAEKDLYFS